jgi:hypothetical protein
MFEEDTPDDAVTQKDEEEGSQVFTKVRGHRGIDNY